MALGFFSSLFVLCFKLISFSPRQSTGRPFKANAKKKLPRKETALRLNKDLFSPLTSSVLCTSILLWEPELISIFGNKQMLSCFNMRKWLPIVLQSRNDKWLDNIQLLSRTLNCDGRLRAKARSWTDTDFSSVHSSQRLIVSYYCIYLWLLIALSKLCSTTTTTLNLWTALVCSTFSSLT